MPLFIIQVKQFIHVNHKKFSYKCLKEPDFFESFDSEGDVMVLMCIKHMYKGIHFAVGHIQIVSFVVLYMERVNPSLAEHDTSCLSKQLRSRFFRSQLIWICTVCH